MSFFRKDKKKEDVLSSKGVADQVPLKQIGDLMVKGLSEKQVIDTLKHEGFSLSSIEKGFNQFKAKQGIKADNAGPVGGVGLQEKSDVLKPSGDLGSGVGSNPFASPSSGLGLQKQELVSGQVPTSAPRSDSSVIEEIQELVEAVVEERLSDLSDKLDDLEGFKTSVDKNINEGLTGFSDLKKQVDLLEKDFNVQKRDFSTLSEELRIELSAMEKALHKLVPQLSASIRSFSKEKGKGSDSKVKDKVVEKKNA